jgi:hypothetical protein
MHSTRIPLYFCCLIIGSSAFAQDEGFQPLFDGETLSGWEGNRQMFRVINGVIVAGSTDAPIELSEFLCTTEEFGDFELKLEARMTGNQIAGVQFRAQRVAGSTEVGGYQADMGFIPGEIIPMLSDIESVESDAPYPLWGSLLDEFRPEPFRYPAPDAPYWLIAVADRSIVDNVLNPSGWNNVSVRAVGSSISIWLNGVQTVDYIEEEPVPETGLICLQVHSGEPSQAMYRNVSLLTIPR